MKMKKMAALSLAAAMMVSVAGCGTKIPANSVNSVDDLDGKTIGAATFINVKNEWNDYSDTGTRANIVKKQKLYTALTAEYTGKVLEGNGINLIL